MPRAKKPVGADALLNLIQQFTHPRMLFWQGAEARKIARERGRDVGDTTRLSFFGSTDIPVRVCRPADIDVTLGVDHRAWADMNVQCR